MTINTAVLKLALTKQFLNHCFWARQLLLDDLLIYATDGVMVKRRFRMLQQLSLYESQILKKIYQFDSDDLNDFTADDLQQELRYVINRSA